jgi:hypothetical protein
VPRKHSPFVALLAELKATFEELGLGWYVFGAQAALLYGSARLTADVDVTVALGEHRTEDLVERLRVHGFTLRVANPTFVNATRVLPVVHDRTGLPADIVLAGPGIEELFLERARLRDLGGLEVPVACAEDIVVMKVLAGREKDRGDVQAILAAQAPTLDVALIRSTLTLLEQALDQRDLLPAFEEAFARAVGHERR